MTVAKLSAAVVLILAIVGAVVGAQNHMKGEIEAATQGVAAQVAEAKQESKRSVSFVSAAHRLDLYESKAEQAEKHLELLRAIGAPEHKIDSTEKEVDFWRAEAHEARKDVTE